MNKTQLTKYVKSLLHEAPAGKIYVEEKDTLIEFFEHHPEWPLKKGAGVDYFYKGDASFNGHCYWIHRTDGTETDIGINAVSTIAWGKSQEEIREQRLMSDVKKACRTAVQPAIERFRLSVTAPFVCQISGEYTDPKDGFHIDHFNLNFSDVFNGWWNAKTPQEQERIKSSVNPTSDGCTDTYFIDKGISADFVAWHNAHTHLRAVSKEANLTKGKSTRNIHDKLLNH